MQVTSASLFLTFCVDSSEMLDSPSLRYSVDDTLNCFLKQRVK